MNQGIIARKFFSVKNVPREECNFLMDEENVQECVVVLNKMVALDTHSVFAQPVNVAVHKNYVQLIKHPMDFSRVRQKLLTGEYKETFEFADDMRTVWMNCEQFNVPGDFYSNFAEQCSVEFERLWKQIVDKLDNLVKDHETQQQRQAAAATPVAAQSASVSSSSSSSQANGIHATPSTSSHSTMSSSFTTNLSPSRSSLGGGASSSAPKTLAEIEQTERELLAQKERIEKQTQEEQARKLREQLRLKQRMRSPGGPASHDQSTDSSLKNDDDEDTDMLNGFGGLSAVPTGNLKKDKPSSSSSLSSPSSKRRRIDNGGAVGASSASISAIPDVSDTHSQSTESSDDDIDPASLYGLSSATSKVSSPSSKSKDTSAKEKQSTSSSSSSTGVSDSTSSGSGATAPAAGNVQVEVDFLSDSSKKNESESKAANGAKSPPSQLSQPSAASSAPTSDAMSDS